MTILTGNPFQSPLNPISLYIRLTAAPEGSPGARLALSLDTMTYENISIGEGAAWSGAYISRMGNDSTENTSDISSCKGNTSLCELAIVGFFAREVVINHLDDGFKGGELHHSIWDLSTP